VSWLLTLAALSASAFLWSASLPSNAATRIRPDTVLTRKQVTVADSQCKCRIRMFRLHFCYSVEHSSKLEIGETRSSVSHTATDEWYEPVFAKENKSFDVISIHCKAKVYDFVLSWEDSHAIQRRLIASQYDGTAIPVQCNQRFLIPSKKCCCFKEDFRCWTLSNICEGHKDREVRPMLIPSERAIGYGRDRHPRPLLDYKKLSAYVVGLNSRFGSRLSGFQLPFCQLNLLSGEGGLLSTNANKEESRSYRSQRTSGLYPSWPVKALSVIGLVTSWVGAWIGGGGRHIRLSIALIIGGMLIFCDAAWLAINGG